MLRGGSTVAECQAAGFSRSTSHRERNLLALSLERPRVTDAQRAEAIRLRVEDNLSTPTIAHRVGLSTPTVYLILKGHPWDPSAQRRYVTFTPDHEAALRRMYFDSPKAEVMAAVPGHSWGSIQGFARKVLKLKRGGAVLARVDRGPIHPLVRQLRLSREELGVRRRDLRDVDGNRLNMEGWERGVTTPSIQDFVRWADALGYDVELRARTWKPAPAPERVAVPPLVRIVAPSVYVEPKPKFEPADAVARPPILRRAVEPASQYGRAAVSPVPGPSPSVEITSESRRSEEDAIAAFLATRGVTRVPPVGDPELARLNEEKPLVYDAKKHRYTRAAPEIVSSGRRASRVDA